MPKSEIITKDDSKIVYIRVGLESALKALKRGLRKNIT